MTFVPDLRKVDTPSVWLKQRNIAVNQSIFAQVCLRMLPFIIRLLIKRQLPKNVVNPLHHLRHVLGAWRVAKNFDEALVSAAYSAGYFAATAV